MSILGDLFRPVVKVFQPVINRVNQIIQTSSSISSEVKIIVNRFTTSVNDFVNSDRQESHGGQNSPSHSGEQGADGNLIIKGEDVFSTGYRITDISQITQGLSTENYFDVGLYPPEAEASSALGRGASLLPGYGALGVFDIDEAPFGNNTFLGGAGIGLPATGLLEIGNFTPQQSQTIQQIDPDNLESASLGIIALSTDSKLAFLQKISPYAYWAQIDIDDNPPTLGVWGTEGAMIVDLPEIDWPWPEDDEGIWTLPPDTYPDPDNLPEIDWPWPEDDEGIWTLPPDTYPDPDNLPEIDWPWPDMPEEERGPGSNILAAEEEGDEQPEQEEREPFPNQLPENLQEELEIAEELGVKPLHPGDPGFDEALNSGTVKWAVTVDGELVIVPKIVEGQEIAHAVLTEGEPVQAAGEAEIVGDSESGYYGLNINRYSGHYMPDVESLEDVGIPKFSKHGITFDPSSIDRMEDV